MSLEQEVQKGGEAQRFLDDQLFKDACESLEAQMRQLRKTVPIGHTDMHTRLILMEQLYESLMSYFRQVAQTGKMASVQLEDKLRQQSIIERGMLAFRRMGRNY